MITLESPPVNTLTKDTFLKLTAAIKELEADPKCEAVLLTSSCRVFSAGTDYVRLKIALFFFIQSTCLEKGLT